ncbi:MAG: sulfite exporter TauE/SafE family protein [Cyanobacteria bacterium P01_G01_bin.38]
MLSFLDIALFATLGLAAGTSSGMLGIGGGMVIVPGLFYLFSRMHLPSEALMHFAAGTAMCIMVFTAASSTLSHHLRGDVQWSIFKNMIGFIGLGVVLGNLLSNHLNTLSLELIFGLFLLVVSSKILLGWKPTFDETTEPSKGLSGLVGSILGFKSGVLGIGGGAISVPFLLYCGLPMPRASGTSASFTLPIAVVGALSFLLFSHPATQLAGATGYIYWPTVALVAPFTMLGAPLGTILSHRIPRQQLRKVFALLLLVVGVRMLGGGLQGLA